MFGKDKITLILRRSTGRNRVWLDGVELDTDESRELRDHSPGGFDWAYGGSGAAQLAVAICSKLWPELWTRIYQDFKWMYLATMKDDDFMAVNIDLSESRMCYKQHRRPGTAQGLVPFTGWRFFKKRFCGVARVVSTTLIFESSILFCIFVQVMRLDVGTPIAYH